MTDYKEYDLLPCPWCENPVHVDTLGVNVVGQNKQFLAGFYITCGNYNCNCPGTIVYETEEEAVREWNNGNTIIKINGRI